MLGVVACAACKSEPATEPTRHEQPGSATTTKADATASADAAAPDAVSSANPATKAQRVEVAFLSSPIAVDAQVPVGWIRRDPITTWDPPDANTLPTWHRSFEITATCDGGCTPKELEPRVARLLDAVVARHRQPNMSGNAEQDAKAIAPVKVLERGDLPQGGQFVLVRVEKPPAFASEPYPGMFAGTCITRRPTDEFMVITHIKAAPDDETVWWPVLVTACKATTIAAPPSP